MGRYVRVAAGTLDVGLAAGALCVSGGWHIGGLVRWVCAGIGLFTGVWFWGGFGWVAMCECRLAHWGWDGGCGVGCLWDCCGCLLFGFLPWRLALLWALCVNDGLHIGGWSGVNGAGFGLFVGFWSAAGAVAVVMCKWRLAYCGLWRFCRVWLVWGVACLLGSGLCLVLLWWLCVSGSWHFGR